MIIHHSLKILEQLSQVEELIKKIEQFIEKEGLNVDAEEVLKRILRPGETFPPLDQDNN